MGCRPSGARACRAGSAPGAPPRGGGGGVVPHGVGHPLQASRGRCGASFVLVLEDQGVGTYFTGPSAEWDQRDAVGLGGSRDAIGAHLPVSITPDNLGRPDRRQLRAPRSCPAGTSGALGVGSGLSSPEPFPFGSAETPCPGNRGTACERGGWPERGLLVGTPGGRVGVLAPGAAGVESTPWRGSCSYG